MRQIVLDTETTGLSSQDGDRVVEIGCVELLNRKLTDVNFHCYLNPERDMPEGAFRVHGLSTEFLADKPRFAEVAQAFLDFVGRDELIIHNASFDIGFLDTELTRAGLTPLSKHCPKVVDTLALARGLFPGKRASLDVLCDRLKIDRSERSLHGALLDAELLADVYIALTRGQDSLLATNAEYATSQRVKLKPLNMLARSIAVQSASPEDLLAFEAMLAYLDKESNGKTLWRQVLATAPQVAS